MRWWGFREAKSNFTRVLEMVGKYIAYSNN